MAMNEPYKYLSPYICMLWLCTEFFGIKDNNRIGIQAFYHHGSMGIHSLDRDISDFSFFFSLSLICNFRAFEYKDVVTLLTTKKKINEEG